MAIYIRNLQKAYGEKRVIRNLSLDIDDGDILCIKGESGSGKTTLFRLLMGLEDWDLGEIQMTGRRISCVFQEDRLFEELNPVKNIRFTVNKTVTNEEILNHLQQILPEDCKNRPVKKLSGGMKRRVCILRAMLSDSDILIFDEPFTGLDDETKEVTIAYIKRYLNGRTLLYATHDRTEMQRLGGRVFELQPGTDRAGYE